MRNDDIKEEATRPAHYVTGQLGANSRRDGTRWVGGLPRLPDPPYPPAMGILL